MNFKSSSILILTVLFTLFCTNTTIAQSDITLKNGGAPISHLNDTGITWAGEFPSSNNTDCTSEITSPQDCNTGRDVTANNNSDGHAGFSFIKLDANGTPLDNQGVAYTDTPWSCVKDNVTGLVWEVKTTTPGIHNQDNTYQWGGTGAIGRDHPNRQGTYYNPSWNGLVQGSNNNNFCGYNNWRIPTVAELSSTVNRGTFNPSIDSDYFPNTIANWFWSSSASAKFADYAWVVFFSYGFETITFRKDTAYVRLVSSG